MENKTKNKLYLKEFIRFLKSNNLIEKYLKNVDCEKAKQFRRGYNFQFSTLDFIIDILKKNPYNLILYAFDWTSTDEGYAFWESVSFRWCHYLKKMYRIIKKF